MLAACPPLVYGTAWKEGATSGLVLQALAAGFRAIDTAAQRKHYREHAVGEALLAAERARIVRRDDVWVQTKYTPIAGQDRAQPLPYSPEAPVREQVRASALASLRALHHGPRWDFSGVAGGEASAPQASVESQGKGKQRLVEPASDADAGASSGSSASSPLAQSDADADEAPVSADEPLTRPWLDALLLHSPLDSLEDTLEVWDEMQRLREEGWVRNVGFSNIYDARIWDALLSIQGSERRPALLQNRWHVSTGHDVSLLASLSPVLSPNIGGAAVTYQPFWILSGNGGLLSAPAVRSAAERLQWTPHMVVLRFVAQGMGIGGLSTSVLCGTTNETHMRQTVAAVLGPDGLEDSEMDAIRHVVYGE